MVIHIYRFLFYIEHVHLKPISVIALFSPRIKKIQGEKKRKKRFFCVCVWFQRRSEQTLEAIISNSLKWQNSNVPRQ